MAAGVSRACQKSERHRVLQSLRWESEKKGEKTGCSRIENTYDNVDVAVVGHCKLEHCHLVVPVSDVAFDEGCYPGYSSDGNSGA